MNWSQYGPAVLAAFIGVTCTDGVFALILARRIERNAASVSSPWRATHPLLRFMLSRIWAAVTCSVFLFSCGFFGLTSMVPAFMFAMAIWLAVAVPLVGSAQLSLRIDGLTVIAHAFEWLVKLVICAGAAYYFL